MKALWGAGRWLEWIVDTFLTGDWGRLRYPHGPDTLAGLLAVPPAGPAQGAFLGVSTDHRLTDLGIAGGLGVLAELADMLSEIGPKGCDAQPRIATCGRDVRSAAPLLASLVGSPVAVPADPETETRGSAVLAACGIGLFAEVAAAAEKMAPEVDVYLPTADWTEYAAALREQREVHRGAARSRAWVHEGV